MPSDLAERVGETVHLTWLRGRYCEFGHVADGHRLVRVASRLGFMLPAHTTSGGKAELAALHPSQVELLYRDSSWERPTEATIGSLEEFAVLPGPRPRTWLGRQRRGGAAGHSHRRGLAIGNPNSTIRGAVALRRTAVPPAGRGTVPFLAQEVIRCAARGDRVPATDH